MDQQMWNIERIMMLEGALKKYGVHIFGKCDLLGESGVCTCGLQKVIDNER